MQPLLAQKSCLSRQSRSCSRYGSQLDTSMLWGLQRYDGLCQCGSVVRCYLLLLSHTMRYLQLFMYRHLLIYDLICIHVLIYILTHYCTRHLRLFASLHKACCVSSPYTATRPYTAGYVRLAYRLADMETSARHVAHCAAEVA